MKKNQLQKAQAEKRVFEIKAADMKTVVGGAAKEANYPIEHGIVTN